MLTSYRKDEVDIDKEFDKIRSLIDNRKHKLLLFHLTKLEYMIALRGLNEEQFTLLLDFYVNDDIDAKLRNRITYCLVPQSVIQNENVLKAVMWVLKNALTDTAVVAQFLDWIKAITMFKLVDIAFLRKYYDLFIKIMHCDELVKPLCLILELIADSSVVTANNVYLLNRAFAKSKCSNIKQLLQHLSSINPNLVPEKFHKQSKVRSHGPFTGIETVMKKAALRLQIDWKLKEQIFLPNAPVLDFSDETNMPEIKNMHDLGKNICLGRDLPQNHLNLLTSQEGVMAIVADGPTPKFLAELKNQLEDCPETIIESVVTLQHLLKRGLHPVFDYLSTFLTTWDGFYKEHIVYHLLPWLRFETFEKLQERILSPLTRTYVSSSEPVKVKIVNALSDLLINLATVDSHEHDEPQWMAYSQQAMEALIAAIIGLINTGILLEGVKSNALLLHGLNFYYKLAKLYLGGNLHCFYPVPESISFSTLCSLDPTLLNELCCMFTLYKQELVPFIQENGSAELYERELEMIERVADNIYDYIWAAESGVQMSQMNGTSMYSRTNVSEGVGRKHLALQVLTKAVSAKLKFDPSKLSHSDLLRIFNTCAGGVSNFIVQQERNHV